MIPIRSLLFILSLVLFYNNVSAQRNKIKRTETLKPFVLGVIEELKSSILSETRTLNIYLPDNYNASDSIKYPVIYLLDGAADEDFIHVVGLVQFNTFEWINRIPKSIVIGISNTDRKRDFTYPSTLPIEKSLYKTSGKSEKFIAFIEKELQPYVQNKFKTTASKTIIGQSLGGLLATEILLKKPTLFNKYIIISPSLWWDNGSLLKINSQILNGSFINKTDVYIACGKEGLAPSENPHVMEVDVNLLVEKLKTTKSKYINTYFDYLPQEDHASISHQAIFNALRYLYPIVGK